MFRSSIPNLKRRRVSAKYRFISLAISRKRISKSLFMEKI